MKTCSNCKYDTGFYYPDPCMSCEFLADNRNNWEPAETVTTALKDGTWLVSSDNSADD